MRYSKIQPRLKFQGLSIAVVCATLLLLNEFHSASTRLDHLGFKVISEFNEACDFPGYPQQIFRLERQKSPSKLGGDICVNVASGETHCPINCQPFTNVSSGTTVPPFCVEANGRSNSKNRLACKVRRNLEKSVRKLLGADHLQEEYCTSPGETLERHTGNPLFGDVCRGLKISNDQCPLKCELHFVNLRNEKPVIAPPYCIDKAPLLLNTSSKFTVTPCRVELPAGDSNESGVKLIELKSPANNLIVNGSVALLIRGGFGKSGLISDDIIAAKSFVEMVCEPLLELSNSVHVYATIPLNSGGQVQKDRVDAVTSILKRCGNSTFEPFLSSTQRQGVLRPLQMISNDVGGDKVVGEKFGMVMHVRHDLSFKIPINEWKCNFTLFNFYHELPERAANPRATNDHLFVVPGKFFEVFKRVITDSEVVRHEHDNHTLDKAKFHCFSNNDGHWCWDIFKDILGAHNMGFLVNDWIGHTAHAETPLGCLVPRNGQGRTGQYGALWQACSLFPMG